MSLEQEVWDEIFVPVVAEQLGIGGSEVQPDKSFDDYNADSLDTLAIAMETEERIEKHYNLEKFSIPENIKPEPRNLGEFRDYIGGRLRELGK